MDKKYLLNHLIRFVSTLIAALLIGFVVFHLSGSGESDLSTSVARRISAGHGITAQAYIFRSETVLSPTGQGLCYSDLSSGTRVMKNGKVAGLYSATKEQISALRGYDGAIALLQASNGKTAGSAVQNDLKKHIAALRADLASGDALRVRAAEAKLQIYVNLKGRIGGSKTDFTKEIADLQRQRDALLSSLGTPIEQIYAPVSGNFYPDADGYEQIFSADKIDGLTADLLLELAKNQPAPLEEQTAGILQTGTVWYAALVSDDPAAAEMTVGKSYRVDFGASGIFPMTLHTLTPDTVGGRTLIVFRSNLTPPEGRPARSSQVSFFSESHEGLMVPTAALRYLKAPEPEEGKTPIPDDTGVYVKEGNKLIFKRVKILCAGEGFYVVKESDPKDEHAKSYLALNDVIVTSGKGLAEGYRN